MMMLSLQWIDVGLSVSRIRLVNSVVFSFVNHNLEYLFSISYVVYIFMVRRSILDKRVILRVK